MRVTEQAHEAVRRVVKAGETVCDATAGNGHDTVFLAHLVGPAGRVIAIDLQEAALISTRRRLDDHQIEHERVQLIQGSHGDAACWNADEVAAVMFNLGYLPGGDHALTTTPHETLAALGLAWRALRSGGVLSVVCYRGHPGGLEEAEAVQSWAESLVEASVEVTGQQASTSGPYLVVVRRLGEDTSQ